MCQNSGLSKALETSKLAIQSSLGSPIREWASSSARLSCMSGELVEEVGRKPC